MSILEGVKAAAKVADKLGDVKPEMVGDMSGLKKMKMDEMANVPVKADTVEPNPFENMKLDHDASEVDDFTPTYTEAAPVHSAEDQPFVDYLKEDVGFSHVSQDVKGNDLKVYTQAIDDLYELLPLKKGTPRSVLSLRNRLAIHPIKDASSEANPLPSSTRGAFSNTEFGDQPKLFLRKSGAEGSTDYFEKIRVVQHEWFHALDDYLLTHFSDHYKWHPDSGDAKLQSDVGSITAQGRMASGDDAKLSGMRPELFDKWDRLRTAVVTPAVRGGLPNMAQRVTADASKKDYLAKNWEMMSRAFEQYMELKESAKFGEQARIARGVNYPGASEMKILEPLFDDFFAELSVKKMNTRGGRRSVPAWYSAPVVAAGAGAMTPDEARAEGWGESIIKAIKRHNEANAASIETAQPVEKPQKQKAPVAPPLNEWSKAMQDRFVNESTADETPAMFWNRVHN